MSGQSEAGAPSAVSRALPPTALSILVAGDTVLDPLAHFLAAPDPAPVASVLIGPYNQVQPLLLDADHSFWAHPADACVLWTTPTRTIPAFDALLNFRPASVNDILAEVDRFAELVVRAASRVPLLLVVSWSLPPYRRWVQAISLRPHQGAADVLMRMNLRLAERLSAARNTLMLDSGFWHASVQRRTFDPKLHALAKVEYSRELFECAARELKAVLRAVHGQARKLVICDLDDTLWGGIVGDDGMEGLSLGGHDPRGESHVELQRELLTLKNRGILLAVCSKNEEPAALEAINRHPEMVLRQGDFVSLKINWQDKAQNIERMLEELNLLPSAAVFLDDAAFERDRVRQALPEVLVPELPSDVSRWPSLLASLDCFETVEVTSVDLDRTRLYQQEVERSTALSSAGSFESWLSSLQLKVTVCPVDRASLPRASQLLNKANQFNLAGRRLSEAEYWDWCQRPGRVALAFWVADRFGNAGLCGVLSGAVEGACGTLVDFAMSCRVMGKQAEDAMLWAAVERMRAMGATTILAPYRPTSKNEPIRKYIFAKYGDEPGTLEQKLLHLPSHIQLVQGFAQP
jgi:FkbH-like protein